MKKYETGFIQMHKAMPIFLLGFVPPSPLLYLGVEYFHFRDLGVWGILLFFICATLISLGVVGYFVKRLATEKVITTLDKDCIQIDFIKPLWFIPTSFRIPIAEIKNFSTTFPSPGRGVWYFTIDSYKSPQRFSIQASTAPQGNEEFLELCSAIKAKIEVCNANGANITFRSAYLRMMTKTIVISLIVLSLLIFADKMGWIR